MKEFSTCPACSSKSFSEMRQYSHPALVKCDKCHLVFSKYNPEEDELISHYEDYGRNDYLSPITIKRYQSILQSFETFRKTNNILDVGCGIGFFLDEALKLNWKAFGTEYTDEAIDICKGKGIEMTKGEINSKDFSCQFDVITSFEVLEHIKNPDEHISKLSSILRPGGLIYITTPNFNSLNRRILKDKWNVISYPEHLTYFTKLSLHNLLVSNGFKKVSLKSDGLSPGRLFSSSKGKEMDFSSDNTTDENLRTSIERNFILRMAKNIVNWKLNMLGLGENLKAQYVKL